MTYASEVLADSPVAWYRLAETGGSTLADSSGNGRNGTLSGSGWSFGAAGIVPDNAAFQHTARGYDYATISHNAVFEVNTSTGFTIEAWIYPTSTPSTKRYIASKDELGGGVRRDWWLTIDDTSKVEFTIFDTSGSSVAVVASSTLALNQWYQIVATVDTSSVARLYINGSQVAATTLTGAPGHEGKPVNLFHYIEGWDNYFTGRFDEIAFYGTALSSTRVAAHYSAMQASNDSPPVAALTVTPSSGIAPLSVTADASGSTDTDSSPISTYTFNFGDGTTVGPQSGASATHSYTIAGDYTATVTVTDSNGLTATATRPVSVVAAPTTPYDTAVLDDNPVAYWRLGETSGPTLMDSSGHGRAGTYSGTGFTFGQPGIVSDNTSLGHTARGYDYATVPHDTVFEIDLSVGFTIEAWVYPTASWSSDYYIASKDELGIGVRRDWYFRVDTSRQLYFDVFDASGNTIASVHSSGTISLNAWTHLCATVSTAGLVTVYVNGSAAGSATLTGTPGHQGKPVNLFHKEEGYDNYFIGRTDELAVYNHALSSSRIATHAASATNVDQPPVAVLNVTPLTGTVPLAVSADASASTDGDVTPISLYTFSFGDGTVVGPQASATATHSYLSVGTYTVTLTVQDSGGQTSTTTQTVTVTPVDSPPVARLNLTPNHGTPPLNVTANASASSDTDGTPIATYTFNFGDGTTVGPQSSATASHTYTALGSYTVTVTVRDTAGQSSTASGVVMVSNTTGTSSYDTAVLADAPVAYYRLNESGGTTMVDSSGGGHNGTYTGTITYQAAGVAPGDGAIALTVGPDYASVADNAAFEISTSTGFSFEAWVFPTTSNLPGFARKYIASKFLLKILDNGHDYEFWLESDNTVKLQIFGAGGDGASSVCLLTGPTLTANQWAHLVFTVGTDNGVHLYANGYEVTSGTLSAAPGHQGGDFNLGRRGEGFDSAYAGRLDEVAVYDSELSAARVLAHFNAATLDNPPVATLTLTPFFGDIATSFTADASASTDPDVTPVATYTFDFGDGTIVGPQTSPTATHAYASYADFTVTVTVADSGNLQNTASAVFQCIPGGGGGGGHTDYPNTPYGVVNDQMQGYAALESIKALDSAFDTVMYHPPGVRQHTPFDATFALGIEREFPVSPTAILRFSPWGAELYRITSPRPQALMDANPYVDDRLNISAQDPWLDCAEQIQYSEWPSGYTLSVTNDGNRLRGSIAGYQPLGGDAFRLTDELFVSIVMFGATGLPDEGEPYRLIARLVRATNEGIEVLDTAVRSAGGVVYNPPLGYVHSIYNAETDQTFSEAPIEKDPLYLVPMIPPLCVRQSSSAVTVFWRQANQYHYSFGPTWPDSPLNSWVSLGNGDYAYTWDVHASVLSISGDTLSWGSDNTVITGEAIDPWTEYGDGGGSISGAHGRFSQTASGVAEVWSWDVENGHPDGPGHAELVMRHQQSTSSSGAMYLLGTRGWQRFAISGGSVSHVGAGTALTPSAINGIVERRYGDGDHGLLMFPDTALDYRVRSWDAAGIIGEGTVTATNCITELRASVAGLLIGQENGTDADPRNATPFCRGVLRGSTGVWSGEYIFGYTFAGHIYDDTRSYPAIWWKRVKADLSNLHAAEMFTFFSPYGGYPQSLDVMNSKYILSHYTEQNDFPFELWGNACVPNGELGHLGTNDVKIWDFEETTQLRAPRSGVEQVTSRGRNPCLPPDPTQQIGGKTAKVWAHKQR